MCMNKRTALSISASAPSPERPVFTGPFVSVTATTPEGTNTADLAINGLAPLGRDLGVSATRVLFCGVQVRVGNGSDVTCFRLSKKRPVAVAEVDGSRITGYYVDPNKLG